MTWKEPPPGWYTFGTLVDYDGPIEFSPEVGDDLLPLFERPGPAGDPDEAS
jgi:hypothetical protein